MQREINRENYQNVISMEEYLNKRREIREQEQKKKSNTIQEKSPAMFWTELYI